MSTFRVSDAIVLTIIQAEPDIDAFVNDQSAATAGIPFNDRLATVRSVAGRLDARISQAAEKLEDYDLFVESLGECLVVATALWHSMFLCREYISAVVKSIVDAHAENTLVVTNHFEYYGDATEWGFNFTKQKFDFAISSDTICVSGITLSEFLKLVDRSGTF